MNYKYKITINNESEMSSFAEKLSKKIIKPTSILLFGDLGFGKTVFAKSFISSFCGIEKSEIISPTFCIASEYQAEKSKVLHYDLYRIKDTFELLEIGIECEINNSIILVEWPEIAEHLFENCENLIKIYLSKSSENETRFLELTANFKTDF